ncbi:MAG: L,D-transpeptidase family protein, partial [Pseudomonadota bacterium]
MRSRLGTLAGSIALAALVTGVAAAQDESAATQADTATVESAPENLLPEAQSAEAEQAEETKTPDASFDDAFPTMVSEPVIQGAIEAPAPLVRSWSVPQARQLIEVITTIGDEGLDPADYDFQALNVALGSGPSEELDRLASRNFIWLVEDLRDGRTPMEARKQWFVVDPDRDKYRTSDLLRQALETNDVAGTLASLQPEHPDYAKLRDELAATPETEVEKRKLIRANMDRWRWLAKDLGLFYLYTNVPEFQARLVIGDKIHKSYRTIVGKPGRTATPQLAETISGVVFNPTWTVPQSIVKGEGLGERVLNNPGWARAKGYKATRGANGYISVVQQPGPTNSLGRMKLEMPNRHAIFFHDTPSRGLFSKANRALSHGCIRTEDALELAITMAILGKGATKQEAFDIVRSG